MTTILLTGGTGFAGRCLIEVLLRDTDAEIVSLERKPSPLRERVTPLPWDFREPMHPDMVALLTGNVKYFIHLGAEVHALRSLTDPGAFVQSNVVGTFHALEVARYIKPELFVYMSSAEVLGGRDEGYSKEDDRLMPSNPYSATKAAGELLTYSYFRTFDLPAIIVRTMNMYGEGQNDVTKFVPMVQDKIRKGEPIKIHVRNGQPGSRQWILGTNFAHQLLELLPKATIGEIYHIIGEEFSNVEMAARVAEEMGIKDIKCELVRISKTHEWRYAMQATR